MYGNALLSPLRQNLGAVTRDNLVEVVGVDDCADEINVKLCPLRACLSHFFSAEGGGKDVPIVGELN